MEDTERLGFETIEREIRLGRIRVRCVVLLLPLQGLGFTETPYTASRTALQSMLRGIHAFLSRLYALTGLSPLIVRLLTLRLFTL